MSEVEVFTTLENINISSLGLDVVQDNDGIKAEFIKGEIKIKDKRSITLVMQIRLQSSLN